MFFCTIFLWAAQKYSFGTVAFTHSLWRHHYSLIDSGLVTQANNPTPHQMLIFLGFQLLCTTSLPFLQTSQILSKTTEWNQSQQQHRHKSVMQIYQDRSKFGRCGIPSLMARIPKSITDATCVHAAITGVTQCSVFSNKAVEFCWVFVEYWVRGTVRNNPCFSKFLD